MFDKGHFANRQDAGRQLCDRLPRLDPASSVVVALPRGGVPVGAVVAKCFGVALDVLLISKVGLPGRPELALGAVSNGDDIQVTTNTEIADHYGLSVDDVVRLAEREVPELKRRRELYSRGRPPVSLAGKTVIVVDDGVATGATMRAAIKIIRKREPRRILLALPVAPASTLKLLKKDVDQVVCLLQPEPYISVGYYYADFSQVDNGTVIELLRDCNSGGDGADTQN